MSLRFRPAPRSLALTLLILCSLACGEQAPSASDAGPQQIFGSGSQKIALLRPRGEVDRYSVFLWRNEYVGTRAHDLHIWNASAKRGSPPILSRHLGEGLTWMPSPLEEAGLPRHIRWQVKSFDGTGELITSSPRLTASLSGN